MMEGSPVDRIVYLILMIAGLAVILYRRLHWREIFTSNLLLTCFIAYCAISVAWSDFPFIAFKRWFKSLGDPLMALIILSEASPGSGNSDGVTALCVRADSLVHRVHQVFSVSRTRIRPVERHCLLYGRHDEQEHAGIPAVGVRPALSVHMCSRASSRPAVKRPIEEPTSRSACCSSGWLPG